MREPQEINDREEDVAAAPAAAVDVAKAAGVVCTRVPRGGEPGRFVTRVWTSSIQERALTGRGSAPAVSVSG